MKITIPQLREIIQRALKEAAAQGKTQEKNIYSYKRMIRKAASGGNKNTPPFTKKAKGPGKSGLGPF